MHLKSAPGKLHSLETFSQSVLEIYKKSSENEKKIKEKKKKALKMTSQLVIFRAFFFLFLNVPPAHPPSPTLNLKKFPVNQLIKKSVLINIQLLTISFFLIQFLRV